MFSATLLCNSNFRPEVVVEREQLQLEIGKSMEERMGRDLELEKLRLEEEMALQLEVAKREARREIEEALNSHLSSQHEKALEGEMELYQEKLRTELTSARKELEEGSIGVVCFCIFIF